jgi:hypothetical protein
VEATNDPVRHNLVERSPGDLLDDQPENNEVGVGVCGVGAGLELHALRGYPLGADERRFRKRDVRGDTARVVEQLRDRDPGPRPEQSRKPVLDRVVEG